MARPTAAGEKIVVGNIEAACSFKCRDLRNSMAGRGQKKNVQQLTEVRGVPSRN